MRLSTENGFDALEELRDRALVYVLAYSGVRSGEILSDPRDDRRNGLRWKDVDLENNQLHVLGKNQQHEEVPTPATSADSIECLEYALQPASPEWPESTVEASSSTRESALAITMIGLSISRSRRSTVLKG